MAQEVKLKDLSIEELYYYEKAANKVCTRLENANNLTFLKDEEIYHKFNEFNKIYQNIINEMENRVKNIK